MMEGVRCMDTVAKYVHERLPFLIYQISCVQNGLLELCPTSCVERRAQAL